MAEVVPTRVVNSLQAAIKTLQEEMRHARKEIKYLHTRLNDLSKHTKYVQAIPPYEEY